MTARAKKQSKGTVVLTAGGTGGHMFPAIALAAALIERGYHATLLTDERGTKYAKQVKGLESVIVPSASPSRGGLLGKIGFIFTLMRGAFAAGRELRKQQAKAVVGFGGYASFPACFVAARQRRPVILHEQNAHLGLANRWLRNKADAIALSFDHVEAVPESGVELVNTGNPVRQDIIEVGKKPYRNPGKTGKFRLLVLGGSQGARIFSDVVPEAVRLLPPADAKRLEITQQCRPEDLERVEAAYKALGAKAELGSFFDDIPARLAKTHLMVCRAGASTVAEALVSGRPAIFVPYPYAADDHQTANAREMDAEGAGWLISQPEFTAETLASRLSDAINHPNILSIASTEARRIAKPDAAERLAALVEHVLTETAR